MSEIRLDTPHGCRDELQRCANGIAQLIPELTKALREEAETQLQYDAAEAIATVQIADAGLAATRGRLADERQDQGANSAHDQNRDAVGDIDTNDVFRVHIMFPLGQQC